MKFGKHIQKRQLEIPEYAASFVDYKALKKLIKKLSSTPVIPALGDSSHGHETLDPQTSLQANKATFFFRVVCFKLVSCLTITAHESIRNASWRKSTPFTYRKRPNCVSA
jgi:hypothetical protein